MTIADAVAAARPAPLDREPIAALRAQLEGAAIEAARGTHWTAEAPLRLTKSLVGRLLRCPRRAVAPEPDAAGDDVVLGALVDAAAKVATIRPLEPDVAVDAALGWLAVDEGAADHLEWIESRDPEARAALLAEGRERIARLLAGWPQVADDRWPRIDEWLRVHLAGGAVSVAGRLDATFGGPPTPHPAVLVEVKGGRWRDEHRADAHVYALLAALRDGAAPAAVATFCAADGRVNIEPVREGVLESAAVRVAEALSIAAALDAGEPPVARPGVYCETCPVLATCDEGRARS